MTSNYRETNMKNATTTTNEKSKKEHPLSLNHHNPPSLYSQTIDITIRLHMMTGFLNRPPLTPTDGGPGEDCTPAMWTSCATNKEDFSIRSSGHD